MGQYLLQKTWESQANGSLGDVDLIAAWSVRDNQPLLVLQARPTLKPLQDYLGFLQVFSPETIDILAWNADGPIEFGDGIFSFYKKWKKLPDDFALLATIRKQCEVWSYRNLIRALKQGLDVQNPALMQRELSDPPPYFCGLKQSNVAMLLGQVKKMLKAYPSVQKPEFADDPIRYLIHTSPGIVKSHFRAVAQAAFEEAYQKAVYVTPPKPSFLDNFPVIGSFRQATYVLKTYTHLNTVGMSAMLRKVNDVEGNLDPVSRVLADQFIKGQGPFEDLELKLLTGALLLVNSELELVQQVANISLMAGIGTLSGGANTARNLMWGYVASYVLQGSGTNELIGNWVADGVEELLGESTSVQYVSGVVSNGLMVGVPMALGAKTLGVQTIQRQLALGLVGAFGNNVRIFLMTSCELAATTLEENEGKLKKNKSFAPSAYKNAKAFNKASAGSALYITAALMGSKQLGTSFGVGMSVQDFTSSFNQSWDQFLKSGNLSAFALRLIANFLDASDGLIGGTIGDHDAYQNFISKISRDTGLPELEIKTKIQNLDQTLITKLQDNSGMSSKSPYDFPPSLLSSDALDSDVRENTFTKIANSFERLIDLLGLPTLKSKETDSNSVILATWNYIQRNFAANTNNPHASKYWEFLTEFGEQDTQLLRDEAISKIKQLVLNGTQNEFKVIFYDEFMNTIERHTNLLEIYKLISRNDSLVFNSHGYIAGPMYFAFLSEGFLPIVDHHDLIAHSLLFMDEGIRTQTKRLVNLYLRIMRKVGFTTSQHGYFLSSSDQVIAKQLEKLLVEGSWDYLNEGMTFVHDGQIGIIGAYSTLSPYQKISEFEKGKDADLKKLSNIQIIIPSHTDIIFLRDNRFDLKNPQEHFVNLLERYRMSVEDFDKLSQLRDDIENHIIPNAIDPSLSFNKNWQKISDAILKYLGPQRRFLVEKHFRVEYYGILLDACEEILNQMNWY